MVYDNCALMGQRTLTIDLANRFRCAHSTFLDVRNMLNSKDKLLCIDYRLPSFRGTMVVMHPYRDIPMFPVFETRQVKTWTFWREVVVDPGAKGTRECG